MRNLNMEELDEVQGGKISGTLAVSIIGIISDVWTLAEAFINADFKSVGIGTSVDAAGYNAMGDYTNGICAK